MGRLGEARLNTTPSVTTHGLSPIVRSARHRRLRRPRLGTAGHRAGRSCSAQRWMALPAAGPTGAAGRGPRRKLPGTTGPSHIDRGPTGTRAVSGLRERRATVLVHVKQEQAPQGATGRGLGWSRGPQVDRRRSTILEQSCGRRTGGATVGLCITAVWSRIRG